MRLEKFIRTVHENKSSQEKKMVKVSCQKSEIWALQFILSETKTVYVRFGAANAKEIKIDWHLAEYVRMKFHITTIQRKK